MADTKSAKDLFEEHGEEVSDRDIADAKAQYSDKRTPEQILLDKVIGGSKGIAAGAGQGATLGLGDEILAGVAAPIKNFATEGKAGNIPKTYTEIRDLLRKKYGELEEENPGTTGLGEAIGSFAAPMPSSLLPILKMKELQKGKEVGDIIKNITRATTEGGLVGGTIAAANSTAPAITREGFNPEGAAQVADEAIPGVEKGGLFGGAIGTIASGKDLLSLTPGGKQFFDVANLSRSGIGMNPNKRGQDLLATLKLSVEKLRGVMKSKGEELNAALENVNRELSPDTIDTALQKIQELKATSLPGQPKTRVDIDPDYLSDLKRLEDKLLTFRYGNEVNYGATLKGFEPGKQLPGDEEIIQNKLNDKQSLLSAADASGQGEEQAINKLKMGFAKKQMNQGSDSPFAPSLVNDNATGETGFKVYNPEKIDESTGEIMPSGSAVEIIKRSNPGEMITIPIGDKKVMGFKLKSGKFYGKVVDNAPGSSLPAGPRTEIKPTTEELNFTQRRDEPNPSPITPSSLRTLQQTIKDIPYGDATAMKTQAGENIAKGVEYNLRNQLKEDVPEYKQPLNDLAELNAVTDPIETNKGFTENQKVDEITANLFNLLQRARQDPVAQRKALKLMSTIKRIAPEEANIIIPHVEEKLRQYTLSTKIAKTEQPIMGTQNPQTALVGAVPSLISKGAAKFGKIQRNADKMVQWIEGNPAISGSGAGRKVAATLRKMTADTIKSGVSQIPERSRNALLFSLMQDPGSRELFNKYNDENGVDLFNQGEEVEEGQ